MKVLNMLCNIRAHLHSSVKCSDARQQKKKRKNLHAASQAINAWRDGNTSVCTFNISSAGCVLTDGKTRQRAFILCKTFVPNYYGFVPNEK